jgi:hypothetical protein
MGVKAAAEEIKTTFFLIVLWANIRMNIDAKIIGAISPILT